MHANRLVLLLVVASVASAKAESFPYTGYVTTEDVYVRSGPGRNYYPTDKLAKGNEVEVYRHDPGGWLAIRPPADSYSWVSSRYVEEESAGLGRVTEDRVVARVGSKFSNVRDVIQVRLKQGELVEILDEENTGGQTWLKVAPPSGEFRWISGKFVDQQPPPNGVGEPIRNPKQHFDAVAEEEREAEVHAEVAPVDRGDPAVDQQTGSSAERLVASVREAGWHGSANDAPRSTSTVAPSEVARPRTAASLDAELDAIEAELSAMVVEEPTAWSFASLQRRAESVLDDATTALDRGRIRRVLARIARFEDIQARYQQVNDVLAKTDRANASLGEEPTAGAAAPRTIAIRTNTEDFDGVGILRPVVSKRAGAPQYALVDQRGAVLTFVSPGPGVNLQPHVGKRVGISGSRGFLAELRKPHLSAIRVSSLDAMRR